MQNLVSSNIGIQPKVQFQRYHAWKILTPRFCLAVLLEAELHHFRYNSRYAYAVVLNFGEPTLHNITHKVGVQPKAKLWSQQP
jgi:hypothetical protein